MVEEENIFSETEVSIDLSDFEIGDSEEEVEVEINLDLGGEEEEAPAETEIQLGFDDEEEETSEDDEVALDDDADAVRAEIRTSLESKIGDWYVVHTYSGMEKRVKQNLDSRVKTLNMEDYIHETIVPTEDVVEIRNGVKKTVTRTVLPGYVLVRMDLTDDSWSAVRHTPSVTGFVGHANDPVPLTLDEVVEMLLPAALALRAETETGRPARKKKV
ncbi:MAG: transcription termination/antitermination protein NusG [Propionibacteriaceae bacterium]|jgi:transcriptional antiterminator NusG|nr:transcription termination/antitermination protein NusG [Propionibacteriaceae bacterium]